MLPEFALNWARVMPVRKFPKLEASSIQPLVVPDAALVSATSGISRPLQPATSSKPASVRTRSMLTSCILDGAAQLAEPLLWTPSGK